MKLACFLLVTAFLLAFGLLSGSEAGDGSAVLAHGQPPCTVTLKLGDSIQEAIDKAAEGAVICLGPGTYEENITIKKGLTLRGTGAKPEEVRIVGVYWWYPVIRIESEKEIEVQLENLTAAEAKGDRCVVGYPRLICPDGVQALGRAKAVILNVQVYGNGLAGLRVGYDAKVSLTNSQFFDNRGNGLSVWGWATVTITNSKVSGNWYGLWVVNSAKVNLTNSQVSGNRLDGLSVWDSAKMSLTNSKVSGNRWHGLDVSGSAKVTLTNSKVSGNGWDGLFVRDSATVEVCSSTIEGNGTDPQCQRLDFICNGIMVGGKSQTRITDSKIINNTDWGAAAWLKKCGYYYDWFTGKVTIDERTEIIGNNKTGNHEGEVCLP